MEGSVESMIHLLDFPLGNENCKHFLSLHRGPGAVLTAENIVNKRTVERFPRPQRELAREHTGITPSLAWLQRIKRT